MNAQFRNSLHPRHESRANTPLLAKLQAQSASPDDMLELARVLERVLRERRRRVPRAEIC